MYTTASFPVDHKAEPPILKIRGQCCIKHTKLEQWIDAQPRGGDGGGRGE